MSDPSRVRGFLMSRRARITPDAAGLPAGTGHRRVPGLRREEAAQLAGVSTEYYTRIERGDLTGVSDAVLDRIATALHLDAAESDHLYALAGSVGPAPREAAHPGPVTALRDSARLLLDSITLAPAFLRNDRRDVLAANPLGRALYAQMYEDPDRTPNTARFIFLDPRARQFYADWDLVANNVVALLRAAEGRRPHDRALAGLVGHLAERSDEFRVLWDRHDVRHHHTGRKHYVHPEVGKIDLLFESLPLQPDTGLTLTVYPAEPGSPAERRLALLISGPGVGAGASDAGPGGDATTRLRGGTSGGATVVPRAQRVGTRPALGRDRRGGGGPLRRRTVRLFRPRPPRPLARGACPPKGCSCSRGRPRS